MTADQIRSRTGWAGGGYPVLCEANPDADLIPAAAAGRHTVVAWRWRDGDPEIDSHADAQGFIAE